MTKKLLLAIVTLMLTASGSYAWDHGSGTENDPYIIEDQSDFGYFRRRVNNNSDGSGKYYALSNDIQITGHTHSAPVGMADSPFTGHFDGRGHTIFIKILPLDDTDENLLSYDRAPFGYINTADGYAVKNLHVGGYAGGYLPAGIVSNLISGRIENCTFSGDIETTVILGDEEVELHLMHAGGIAANMSGGQIISCDFSGNVTANAEDFFSYAGGIVGAMSGGKIRGCTVHHYSVITANGNSESERSKSAGGIAGFIEVGDLSTNDDTPTISYCEFEGGEVKSEYTAGGITGTAYGGILSDNTVGDDTRISGSVLAGGVAGLLSAGGTLRDNDVLGGVVSADSRASGGIAGLLELGYVEGNDSRSAVRGSAGNQGGVVGEIHNHYGNSANISGNTYSGSAYGIGVNEHGMRNKDTGCTKNAADTFYFITQSVLDTANEMERYTSAIEMSIPVTIDLSPIPSWLNPVLNGSTIYLSGIPSVTGSYSFTLTANYGEHNISKTYRLNVKPLMSINADDIYVNAGDFIDFNPDVSAVSIDLSNAQFVWSIVSGDFPVGLSINESTGNISGYVDEVGEYVFTLGVTAENVSVSSVTKNITLTVTGITATISIVTDTLPPAAANTYYYEIISCDVPSGFVKRWDVVSGELPNGFTLSADGVISGITPSAGRYKFSLGLTALREVASTLTPIMSVSKDFTLTVTASPISPTPVYSESVDIKTIVLPSGRIGESYRSELIAVPESAVWTHSGGLLPPGLTLSSDGVISGIPSVVGNFSFYVTASHESYRSSTREFGIRVINPSSSTGLPGYGSSGGGGGCESFPLILGLILLPVMRLKNFNRH